jgi:hypothetical protein
MVTQLVHIPTLTLPVMPRPSIRLRSSFRHRASTATPARSRQHHHTGTVTPVTTRSQPSLTAEATRRGPELGQQPVAHEPPIKLTAHTSSTTKLPPPTTQAHGTQQTIAETRPSSNGKPAAPTHPFPEPELPSLLCGVTERRATLAPPHLLAPPTATAFPAVAHRKQSQFALTRKHSASHLPPGAAPVASCGAGALTLGASTCGRALSAEPASRATPGCREVVATAMGECLEAESAVDCAAVPMSLECTRGGEAMSAQSLPGTSSGHQQRHDEGRLPGGQRVMGARVAGGRASAGAGVAGVAVEGRSLCGVPMDTEQLRAISNENDAYIERLSITEVRVLTLRCRGQPSMMHVHDACGQHASCASHAASRRVHTAEEPGAAVRQSARRSLVRGRAHSEHSAFIGTTR